MDPKKKIPQKKELKEIPIVGGGKVLVMEEDKPLRKMLSIMLEFLGYESELARDGDEAIELYKQAMAQDNPIMWSSWT
jgi:ActR/RegA family two-component response regulator